MKKLDELANDIFINSLKSSGKVALMVSEENEQVIEVETDMRGKVLIYPFNHPFIHQSI